MTSTGTEHAGVLQTFRETPKVARFVLLGVFVNQFGAFLQAFLVLYLLERGFSSEQAGIALGAYSVGTIFGVLFGGVLSDRLGARLTIVMSVGSASIFTLSITQLDQLPAIVIAVALSGGMTQASRPAVTALLMALVPPARQVMTLAMYRTALNTGVVLGPLVAVWLSTISWDLVFYFDAASALLYAGIALVLLPKGRNNGLDEDAAADEPATGTVRRAGYLTMLRDGRYLAYLALMLGNGLVHVQFFAVLPLMLKAAGYPTWAYGAASALSAFFVISCELLVTKTTQRWPAWVAVIGGWLLLVIGRGLFGLPGGLTIILAGTLLAAIGQIIGGPAAFAYPAQVAPAGATGRYIGSAHAMFGLGYAVGPIVGIVLWNGLGDGFWGIIFVVGMAMVVPGVWGMRHPRAVAASGPADDQDGDPDGDGIREAATDPVPAPVPAEPRGGKDS
ncbi:MAG TPA: MFS transporter [Pseudonocardiaceae bacterium]